MSSPQCEDGFTKLANELLEKFSRTSLSGSSWRVLMLILRKIYGFGKKEDWISYQQLSKVSGLSKPKISQCIKQLSETGIVSVTRNGNRIIIKILKGYEVLPERVTLSEQVTHSYQKRKLTVTRKVDLTDTTKETIKETITKENSIVSFLNTFNELFERQYKPTAGRIKKLDLRLKSFSLEDILKALQNLAKSPFHRGVNDRGWSADPDFLLRSDEQIDKWINTDMEQAKQLSRLNKEVTYGNKIAGFNQ